MNLQSENNRQTLLALCLICAGIALRVAPHPSNFTPVTAIALFGGVTLNPLISLTVPLIVMIASDLWIGPHELYWLTWGLFVVVSLLGVLLRNRVKLGTLFFGTIGASVLFFIGSNLGVFIFQNMYPKTAAGLVQCFVMALPFFRNSLAGDLFYSAVFFGIFAAFKKTAGILLRVTR